MKYQNKTVSIVREAKEGDAGFDANKDQSLIRHEDGSQTVVLTSEVTK